MVTIFKKYIFPIIMEIYGMPYSKQIQCFLLPDGQVGEAIFEKVVAFLR